MMTQTDPVARDEAEHARKPWSNMKFMLAILGGLVALNVLAHFVMTTPDQADASASFPVKPTATARADAVAFQRQIAQVTMSCEFESAALTVAMMGSDPVTGYQTAKNVDAACMDVSDKLGELSIPQSVGREVGQAYANALKRCQSAYTERWSVAHSLQEALDAPGKISTLADLRRSMGYWKEDSRACDAALSAAPAALGLTPEDLAAALRSPASAPTALSGDAVVQPIYEGTATPAEAALIRKHQEYSADCQTDPDAENACKLREEAYAALTKAGWCFQRPGDVGTDHTWHHCPERTVQ